MDQKHDLTILKKSAEVSNYLDYQCETWKDDKTLNTLDEYFEVINELLKPIIKNASFNGIAWSACKLKDRCVEFLNELRRDIEQ